MKTTILSFAAAFIMLGAQAGTLHAVPSSDGGKCKTCAAAIADVSTLNSVDQFIKMETGDVFVSCTMTVKTSTGEIPADVNESTKAIYLKKFQQVFKPGASLVLSKIVVKRGGANVVLADATFSFTEE
jgi:hypothetical protein